MSERYHAPTVTTAYDRPPMQDPDLAESMDENYIREQLLQYRIDRAGALLDNGCT
jgi:hypothetical protein